MPAERSPSGPAPAPLVAVVGGGISGLAAAWELAALPHPPRVVVLEASGRVGGKLWAGAVGPLEVDLGAESVLARRPEAVALIEAAGLGDALTHPATTRANVVRGGVLHPLPTGTLMGVPGRADALRGLLTAAEVARVAAEPDHPATPLDPDADTDVASWVAGRVGPAVVDRLVEPLLGGVYAGHARSLSLRVTIPALWEHARTGGSLLRAVQDLTAPPPQPRPVFAGVVGGLGRLPVALAQRLAAGGVEIRTGTTVRGLERTGPPDRPRWRLLVGPVPDRSFLDVDAVVLAVPAPPASRLLRDASPPGAAELAGVEAASVAVVALAVPRAAVAGLAGSGVLVPPAERRPVKAMTFSSAKWAWVDRLDPALAVVRLSLGRHREEAVLQRDDADLTALALADAEDLLGGPLTPVASRVVRWGGSLPQPAVGHADRIARLRAAVDAVPGVAVCGAALDGVGIPACIGAARRAAAKVARDLAAPAHGVPAVG